MDETMYEIDWSKEWSYRDALSDNDVDAVQETLDSINGESV